MAWWVGLVEPPPFFGKGAGVPVTRKKQHFGVVCPVLCCLSFSSLQGGGFRFLLCDGTHLVGAARLARRGSTWHGVAGQGWVGRGWQG